MVQPMAVLAQMILAVFGVLANDTITQQSTQVHYHYGDPSGGCLGDEHTQSLPPANGTWCSRDCMCVLPTFLLR